MNIDDRELQRIHYATALVTFVAIVFYLFFQINKGGPFREVNPFGIDPYDAVGSLAIQGALLLGILTYARALRLLADPTQSPKRRLILRGNLLILIAIGVTLIADAIAEIANPLPPSFLGNILLVELILMFLLVLFCAIVLIVVFGRIPTVAPPPHLTPADAIDDLWTLVRIPVKKSNRFLPPALVQWVEGFRSDWLFAKIQWLDPRRRPWRFAAVLGLAAGVLLALAQLQEGLPPSLETGLLVAGIFISGEFAATLLGFVLFGGYLGLRPPLSQKLR